MSFIDKDGGRPLIVFSSASQGLVLSMSAKILKDGSGRRLWNGGILNPDCWLRKSPILMPTNETCLERCHGRLAEALIHLQLVKLV